MGPLLMWHQARTRLKNVERLALGELVWPSNKQPPIRRARGVNRDRPKRPDHRATVMTGATA